MADLVEDRVADMVFDVLVGPRDRFDGVLVDDNDIGSVIAVGGGAPLSIRDTVLETEQVRARRAVVLDHDVEALRTSLGFEPRQYQHHERGTAARFHGAAQALLPTFMAVVAVSTFNNFTYRSHRHTLHLP